MGAVDAGRIGPNRLMALSLPPPQQGRNLTTMPDQITGGFNARVTGAEPTLR